MWTRIDIIPLCQPRSTLKLRLVATDGRTKATIGSVLVTLWTF